MRHPGRSVRDALTVLAFGCCALQSVGLGCKLRRALVRRSCCRSTVGRLLTNAAGARGLRGAGRARNPFYIKQSRLNRRDVLLTEPCETLRADAKAISGATPVEVHNVASDPCSLTWHRRIVDPARRLPSHEMQVRDIRSPSRHVAAARTDAAGSSSPSAIPVCSAPCYGAR